MTSWSRRSALAASAAALACRATGSTDAPSNWTEVRFGRHALDIPPGLLGQHETEFQLGSDLGTESSDRLALQREYAQLIAEAKETVSLYEDSDRLTVRLHRHEIAGAQVMALERNKLGIYHSCKVNFLLLHNKSGLLVRRSHHDQLAAPAMLKLEKYLANLEHLPSQRERSNPYYTPHHELELDPDLGQRIEVLLQDGNRRFLSLESATVRGREYLDMGGATLVHSDLVASRRQYQGTGTANLLRRWIIRRANEMVAPEYAWTTDHGEGGRLNFAWVYRGRAFDVRRPYMVILYSGDLAYNEPAALRREWKQIITSLRSIPQATLVFEYEPG